MVMLRRRSVQWRENSLTVVSLMEGEWLCYGGGQFNGGSLVILQVTLVWFGLVCVV